MMIRTNHSKSKSKGELQYYLLIWHHLIAAFYIHYIIKFPYL